MAAPEVAPKITGEGVKGSMAKMKLPMDLVPYLCIKLIALVFMFGARKYAKNNWLKGMSWSEVAAGAERHLMAFMEGNEFDNESGLPHLAHCACMIVFLLWYAHGPQAKEHRSKCDDRKWVLGEDGPMWDKEVERINAIDFTNIKVPAKEAT